MNKNLKMAWYWRDHTCRRNWIKMYKIRAKDEINKRSLIQINREELSEDSNDSRSELSRGEGLRGNTAKNSMTLCEVIILKDPVKTNQVLRTTKSSLFTWGLLLYTLILSVHIWTLCTLPSGKRRGSVAEDASRKEKRNQSTRKFTGREHPWGMLVSEEMGLTQPSLLSMYRSRHTGFT